MPDPLNRALKPLLPSEERIDPATLKDVKGVIGEDPTMLIAQEPKAIKDVLAVPVGKQEMYKKCHGPNAAQNPTLAIAVPTLKRGDVCTGDGHALAAGPTVGVPKRVAVDSMNPPQRRLFVQRWIEFASINANKHNAFHENSAMNTPLEKGEEQLQFHFNVLKAFEAFLKEKEPELWKDLGEQLPTWNPYRPLPQEFWFKGQHQEVGSSGIRGISSYDDRPFKIPDYLRVGGDSDAVTIGDTTLRTLEDFKDLNELGFVTMTHLHDHGHFVMGGAMRQVDTGFFVAVFPLWHVFLDDIRARWLETESGQTWLRAHPTGWTDSHGNPFH